MVKSAKTTHKTLINIYSCYPSTLERPCWDVVALASFLGKIIRLDSSSAHVSRSGVCHLKSEVVKKGVVSQVPLQSTG